MDPNHKSHGRDHAAFSSADSPHARRNSVHTGTESSIQSARRASQRQVTEAVPDGSQESQAHGMGYSPTDLPTPAQSPPMSPPPEEQTSEVEDIHSDIAHFINEEMDPEGQHSWCFETADLKPPITPESLAELDMPRIINNPKLRHDVNFDRELHFRPNLDGSKGRQKMQQADHYWRALEAELVMHGVVRKRKWQSPDNEGYWERIMDASLVRLPKIFDAIRDIMKTLVPDYDQKVVSERLDVDHIMQQIRNGVCDLIDLGNWLAKVLKNHCAPMRDPLVDSMQKEIICGATDNQPEKLVNGLRLLMNILEAMKLDVANHQIRHMRPLLVDDTINFQRRYNAHRIAIGKIHSTNSKNWLLDNQDGPGREPCQIQTLTAGLVRDILYNDSASMCPQAFYLDSDRLRALRVELHFKVYLDICRDVFTELARGRLCQADIAQAHQALQSSIMAIVGMQGRFTDQVENIAAEIVRVLLIIEGRYPPFDCNLQAFAEHRLAEDLRPLHRAFRQNAAILAERLIPKVQACVQDHIKMSALDLQDKLVPTIAPSRPTVGFGAVCEPVPFNSRPILTDPDEDLVRRLTHILVLHWQVWADLVYLADPMEREDDNVSDNGSDSTIVQSAANSPTVPIATAVYAPGRKWLPISVTVTDVPSGLPSPSPSPKPDDGTAPSNAEQGGEESQDSQRRQPA